MNISSYGREVKLNTCVRSLWAQTGEDKKTKAENQAKSIYENKLFLNKVRIYFS